MLKRYNLPVVNNFRRSSTTENWEARFQEWQDESEEDGDDLGEDTETCFPSDIPEVTINRKGGQLQGERKNMEWNTQQILRASL